MEVGVMKVRNNQGFVLPLVLIILATLTIMSLSLRQMSRGQVELAHQQREQWRDELQVRSNLQLVVTMLLVAPRQPASLTWQGKTIPLDGTWTRFNELDLSIQDAHGLYVAQADHRVWQAVLQHYMSASDAAKTAVRIVDWLDEDSIPGDGGMERGEYIAAGLTALPRNGFFRTLDELLNIPGITPEMFNGSSEVQPALRDLIVLQRGQGFNPATAPEILLGPMLGLGTAEVRQIVTARERQNWEEVRRVIGAHRFGEELRLSTAMDFVIRLRTDSGRTARAIVRLDHASPDVYDILLWYYPDDERT